MWDILETQARECSKSSTKTTTTTAAATTHHHHHRSSSSSKEKEQQETCLLVLDTLQVNPSHLCSLACNRFCSFRSLFRKRFASIFASTFSSFPSSSASWCGTPKEAKNIWLHFHDILLVLIWKQQTHVLRPPPKQKSSNLERQAPHYVLSPSMWISDPLPPPSPQHLSFHPTSSVDKGETLSSATSSLMGSDGLKFSFDLGECRDLSFIPNHEDHPILG